MLAWKAGKGARQRRCMEPPRDYAPKTDPQEQKGTLAEDFGLSEKQQKA